MIRRHALALALVTLFALPLSAATFTVDDLGDASDANAGNGVCATAGAVCTLRAAIEEANASAGADVIAFSVSGSIFPGTEYPAIVQQLDIDGTTAPTYVATPVISIDGAFSVTICFDFATGSDNSRVRALKISGFSTEAIRIASASATIVRNYLGPVGGGTPNGIGLELTSTSSFAQIGNSSGTDGNVISGNMTHGLLISGASHELRDNFIGTNAAGTAALANGADGIRVTTGATDVTIGGFFGGVENVISGNTNDGIEINNASTNRVAGNFIGLDATGLVALPNGQHGVNITNGSTQNDVGNGDTRCYISGNTANGVDIDDTSSANRVMSCFIGVDTTGAAAVPNAAGVNDTGDNNIIGDNNVISGNNGSGIVLGTTASGTTINGNIIGLASDGDAIVGNGSYGISIRGSTNITIGADPGPGNVISGNASDGIFALNATQLHVYGNIIGLRQDETDIRGNGFAGITFFTTTASEIGSLTGGNTISGNSTDGILLLSSANGNSITGNHIGTDSAGTTAFGNLESGIDISGSNDNAVTSNVIAFNGADGITVDTTSTGNVFTANSIFSNTELGIDLLPNGVTPNDPLDPDTGANALQNFPDILSIAQTPTQTFIQGTINSTPNTSLAIHFYANTALDASNFGEGQTYLGTTNVMTDGSGNASFNFTANAVVNFVTATATNATTGTSEFSGSVNATEAPTVQFAAATDTVGEAAGTITITVTRSGNLSSESTVQYATSNGTATQPSDYTSTSGTLTFAPTVASQTFNVPIINDTTDEPDETFTVTLSNPTAATIAAPSTMTVTITDDDAQPSINIDDVSHNEGDSGTTAYTFTVSLSNPSASTITVDYATADNTATQPTDYTSASNTLTFAPGVTSQQFTVNANGDVTFEPMETFFVNLTNPTNATISDNQGTGTLVNDDAQPSILIDDVSHNEGNAGTTPYTFTVTLSNPSASTITVDYATADNTATQPSDYTSATNTLTFLPGQTSQTLNVSANGDLANEATETFFVNLTNPSNATISDAQGTGTIVNDDAVPSILIDDVTHNEGNAGTTPYTFTVTLSNPSGSTVTVDYATADNTATQPSDYTSASNTLTFLPGMTSQTLNVNVNGDMTTEATETFFVNLTNPSNATIGDAQGLGTITNDDGVPSIVIDDVSHNEGDAGTTAYTFTVTLSNPSGSTVTVDYATANNTAAAPGDYTSASNTLTFAPGVTSQQLTVNVNGDTTFEPNESFFVNLTNPTNASISDAQGLGTIVNDDATPTIAINDVPLAEGNSGTTPFTFTVTLSNPSSTAITVDYATAGGSALQPGDYTSASNTLTFAPGVTSQPLTVNVNGDTTFEPDETFTVNLSNANGATIGDAQGTGTIQNDDAMPSIAIGDLSLAEGNAGTTAFTFTVTLSNPSATAITVDFATADGSATQPSDYAPNSGTVNFAPGMTSQTLTVNVNGDTTTEPNETFVVNLTNPIGATISDAQATGTIVNDDGVPLSTDLSIAKSTTSSTFTAGAQLTYTITVHNAGPDAATSVVVTDTLPAGTTYVSATPSTGSCSGTTTVTCSLGTLANAANATITLVVTASGTAPIVNSASVASATADPNMGNNTAAAAPVNPAPAAVEAIPTLSEWALLAFAMVLAMVACARMMR